MLNNPQPILLTNDCDEIAAKIPVHIIAVIDRLSSQMNSSRSVMVRAGLCLLFAQLSIADDGTLLATEQGLEALNNSLAPLAFNPPNIEAFTIHYFGAKDDDQTTE